MYLEQLLQDKQMDAKEMESDGMEIWKVDSNQMNTMHDNSTAIRANVQEMALYCISKSRQGLLQDGSENVKNP
jgi:hypothetical protein